MKGKAIAIAILVLAAAAAYLYFANMQVQAPTAGKIEFTNPRANLEPVIQGNPVYLEGDIAEVIMEIDLPRALLPGNLFIVHEEFVNVWDDEVYAEKTWELDPFDYPSGKILLKRSYDTLLLQPSESEIAEYAIIVTIADSEGNDLSSAVAGFDVLGQG